MKATGIVRNIDQLGRIVIPMETRKVNNLPEGTPMEIYVDGERIILKKFERKCTFCGSSEDLNNHKEKVICQKCISEIKNI